MEARENEIPILNRSPSAHIDHCNLICPSFLRESVNYDQPIAYDQPIDLSNSDYDLNSNIQLTYPETSATSFTENTSGDYFTGNNDTGNGSGCNNSLCRQNGECLTHSHPGNDEDTTTGNENVTGNDTGTGNESGDYRAMGEGLISQLLAQENVDSFAVIYNDGNAHFQGSAPDATFNLSAIEPYEGADSNNESYDDYADADNEFDLEMPIRFEKGHQQ
jgi:hypothetical protein